MSVVEMLLKLLTLNLLILLLAGAAAALTAALLAPLGPLVWWAGWGTRQRADPLLLLTPGPPQPAAAQAARHYIAYLAGIGAANADNLGDRELGYLQRLAAQLPNCVIVHDIFCYAMENQGLTEERLLGRFWLWMRHSGMARGRIRTLGNLVNLRSLLQVLVSADQRYGPIYSCGTAGVIARSLVAHGYPPGQGRPVTLIGYSGGAQIALGAARYLAPALGGPLQLISLGGVMSADPGIAAIEALWHLYGSRDHMQRNGARFFPGRWPLARHSPWNQARAAGKIAMVALGPVAHSGPGSYLDPSPLADGPSFLDGTIAATVRLVDAVIARHA